MKIFTALFCVMFTTLTVSAQNKIDISNEDVVLEAGQIRTWGIKILSVDSLSEKLISCRSVNVLPGKTLACLGVGQNGDLAKVLGAASIFSEGNLGYPAGTLLDRTNKEIKMKLESSEVGGYNLKGEDILNFIAQSSASCEKRNAGHCLSQAELNFFSAIETNLQAKEFNLIAIAFFPMTMGDSYISLLDHEALHVQYFRDAIYRKAIDKFWKEEVAEQDKKGIRQILAKSYDVRLEYVVRNEFQAYLLQLDAAHSILSEYLEQYRDKLSEALKMVHRN